MSADTKSGSKSGGTSVLTLLGVAFIILKLCHVIAWSWVWVLAPFWGGLCFTLVVLAFIAVVGRAVRRR